MNNVYTLNNLLTFAQINEEQRRFLRANNITEAKTFITGTFPIAKTWSDKEVRKIVQIDGISVTDAKVIDINSQWITVQSGKAKHFLKITSAEATYNFTK